MIAPYTVVLTSCGRFDLLEPTIVSLVATLDAPPADFIVIEDSGDEAVREIVRRAAPEARVIVNETRLGQMRSIDRAYAEVGTDWAFHCEDDWEFGRPGYLTESFALLRAFPQFSMVGLRAQAELNPLVRSAAVEEAEGVRFFRLDPALHPEYFGYSFNPGLRRMADLRALGPLAGVGGEEDVSWTMKRRGLHMVNLADPAVRHIGWERHVDDPTTRAKARKLGQRLARSFRKRIKRLRRALGATR
ncbi:glycosyltransferase family 2 protein [Rubrimonas cliftonensis]|uniref:Glycosyltransferase like family 2 n=1 Tax=Rubrimonas cliftonensis TaxID=89524 RepID=A0A1H3XNN0_9RHOB|nr:glycosyltransferase [Rubrimonas cliftonensis]SEA01047.1 Glycosyltransferase like family 2 [Rubrimonas cliftonensis]